MKNISRTDIKTITECSAMVVLSFILSNITVFKMPLGGSITLGSMCPIIIISLKHGTKYGLITGFIYSLIQIFTGFHSPPTKNIISFFLVFILDYIVPYTFLGLSSIFYKKIKYFKLFFSTSTVILIRYISSVASGIIIWKNLFPANTSIFVYSIIYNATYLLPETLITYAILRIIYKYSTKHSDF